MLDDEYSRLGKSYRIHPFTVAWVAVATIGNELSADFKQLLSLIGGHHWIGKSVLSAAFLGLFYLFFSKMLDDEYSLWETG